MSKLSPELKPFFESQIKKLSVPEPKLATNTAVAVLQRDQKSEFTVRNFKLIQDEPAGVLGTGTGPTPTDYFISSVALCENVIFARNAALKGVAVDSLETTATGSWDMRGLYEIGGVDPAFKTILVETSVRSTSPLAVVVEVARQTHRRCPIYATLRKSVDLKFKLRVNGAEVPL
jgi:putative redox protein